jgi:hypothetical protein
MLEVEGRFYKAIKIIKMHPSAEKNQWIEQPMIELKVFKRKKTPR